ncbi:MAG: YceI family protein [Lysinibacillus sp.]
MTNFVIDMSHSTIGFSVRHMMVSHIHGTFESYSAKLSVVNIENLLDANISFNIDVASISTKNFDRDIHLVSHDFFDADKYPKISFVSTSIEKIEENIYALNGNLTIRDITKSVTFDTKYTGSGVNPWNQEVYGFQSKGKIDRRDFNLIYNTLLETGGVLISDEIEITIDLEVNPA